MDTSQSRYKNTAHKIRIVGVDDGAFPQRKNVRQYTLLVAVLVQDLEIQNVRVGRIEVDGSDANKVLMSLLKRMRFDVVMLSGISFGGFNVVDIAELATVIHRPVIALTGDKPDDRAVLKALREHFVDWKARWSKIQAAGQIHCFKPFPAEPPLYFEVKRGAPNLAESWIRATAKISRVPEPVRVARILARGLSGVTLDQASMKLINRT